MESTEEQTIVESHEEWALRKKRERMVVTRFQAKVALMNAGLLDQVETVIASSDDAMAQLAWQEAGFVRLSPLIESMAAELQLTPEQVDELFEAAMQV